MIDLDSPGCDPKEVYDLIMEICKKKNFEFHRDYEFPTSKMKVILRWALFKMHERYNHKDVDEMVKIWIRLGFLEYVKITSLLPGTIMAEKMWVKVVRKHRGKCSLCTIRKHKAYINQVSRDSLAAMYEEINKGE